MTVFSGPSATYAAGYVNGPPAPLAVAKPPNRYPYVLELTADGATVFNAALPTTTAVQPSTVAMNDDRREGIRSGVRAGHRCAE